jgi:hypothetical protein
VQGNREHRAHANALVARLFQKFLYERADCPAVEASRRPE